MSFDYLASRDTASRLIAQFGRQMTIRKQVVGKYSAGRAPVREQPYQATGVSLDYSQREIDGTRIRIGDRRVLLAVGGFSAPNTGDEIEIGCSLHRIVDMRPLDPGGTVVLYDLQVRGLEIEA